jgi:DNA primase catalytic core
MPLAPREEIERIKREVSIQRLAEVRGIKLRRSGKELIGLCPFHKDTSPSLNIDPQKNEWHCKGACGEGGDVLKWVMRAQGISFRHALELLRRDLLPTTSASPGSPPKKGTIVNLPPLIDPAADDKRLLKTVVEYYHETLKQSPEAQQYLIQRGLQSAEMIEHFRLGFANRSIGYRLPASNRVAGAEQRERLKQLGILKNQKPGHEHFCGSLVIPILNLDGDVMQMYGRKITPRHMLREETPEHLYLSGPLRGVWNEQALMVSKEIILCEALIDALTFWCAGFRHVTTIYGVNNFTDELRQALRYHGTKRLYIAYDRDDAGDKAAQEHSEELIEMGIECFRVQFPKGQDANEYARITQPAAKALGLMLNSAAWLGKGKRPSVSVLKPAGIAEAEAKPTEKEEPRAHVKREMPASAKSEKPAAKEKSISAEPGPDVPAAIEAAPALQETILPAAPKLKAERIEPEVGQPVFSLAANEGTAPNDAVQVVDTLPASVRMSSNAASYMNVQVIQNGEEVILTEGDRRYRVRGLPKAMSYEQLRVNLLVSCTSADGFHVDTIDLYKARDRVVFAKLAAEELRAKEETIKRDLQHALMKLEVLQHEQIKRALGAGEEEAQPEMTAEDRAAAMELLRSPRLLDQVLQDFEQCGVVGEETNKKMCYLAAVSRLLEKPLAIVVQSASSAGKSSLMEAVIKFTPPEQRQEYTAMTGQSLFYMGEKNLKHKVLAISEQQGADAAAYPLKLLQSEGRLNIASTGKDPATGKHVTHDYTVEGPVMIFLTTTAHEVDEELLNRCIVLTVNEDREQTRAIHEKQREAQTLEGLRARARQAKILKLHHNAQRLLRPIAVVVQKEYVRSRPFPDTMTRTRRDHMKFLTLIQAITLVHQHQRETKIDQEGDKLEYIEATESDVVLAWELVNQVLMRSLDDVQPQTRRLLTLIDQMVTEECARTSCERLDYRFTRARVRQFTGWGDSQLKKHLSRLEDLEYLALYRGAPGQSFVYGLNFEMDEHGRPVLPGYGYDAKRSRFQGGVSRFAEGVSRGGHGPMTRVSRGGHASEIEESPAMARVDSDSSEKESKNSTRGATSEPGPQNRAVTQVKPNGHAFMKRAEAKS